MTARIRIASVVGARPQFVKAAIVADAVRQHGGADHVVIHTGQHYDREMSEVFFRDLGLQSPDHALEIGSGTHGAQTGAMLAAIERILMGESFDRVVVYGDTNSTLAGALAAAKLHIPVAHVEAGLRSWNRRMPEEVNRVLTDHASDLLFAPTGTARENLLREGVSEARIVLAGDVMYDAVLRFRGISTGVRERAGVADRPYVLATIHRAENTDDDARLRAIVEGLVALAAELAVVLPLHPRTAGALARSGLDDAARRALRIIEPVGYLEMLELETGAALIATDSGGVQKEAFFARVPCVTLRDETEWVELLETGWNVLLPPDSSDAVGNGLLAALGRSRPAEPTVELYGGGAAGARIAERLLDSAAAAPPAPGSPRP